MTVADLVAYLATQPQDALVLSAGPFRTFGAVQVETYSGFTYDGIESVGFQLVPILHEDDLVASFTYRPVVVVGAP